MEKNSTVNLCCSFCGKSQDEVVKLIAGPTVYICDECIGLCKDIIAEETRREDLDPEERARRAAKQAESSAWKAEFEDLYRRGGYDEAGKALALLSHRGHALKVLPGLVDRALQTLGESSRALRAEVERWIAAKRDPKIS